MTSVSTISLAAVHRLQLLGLFDEPDEIPNRADDKASDTQAGEGHLQ